jgi:hypothetical protein
LFFTISPARMIKSSLWPSAASSPISFGRTQQVGAVAHLHARIAHMLKTFDCRIRGDALGAIRGYTVENPRILQNY